MLDETDNEKGALMVKLGIIGYGYWGPNIVRNFCGTDGAQVVAVCDMDEKACQKVSRLYPFVRTTRDSREVTHASDIDAVAIVTPVSTHYELARAALENGKHVFIEKPFTSSSAQAEELIELAERKNLTIMVDHTFLFTGAVRKMKDVIDAGELGRPYYYDSTRVNLGLFQHDVNVVWDLATHDLSIIDYLIPDRPMALVATGQCHVNTHENIAYITIYFYGNMIAHLNVNWLSPVKVRMTLIGGEKKMLVWNDLEPDEKIKIYDKGIDVATKEGVYDLLVSYRSGDMVVPRIEQREALKYEAAYFIDCVRDGVTPFNDGQAGLRIVRMLEATDQSLKMRGEIVYL